MTKVPDIRQVLLLETFFSVISNRWLWEYNYRAADGELVATGCAQSPEIAIQRVQTIIGRPLDASQIRELNDEGRE